MTTTLSILLLSAAFLPATPPADANGLTAHPDVASRLALYESWIREQMAYQHQPGVVVGIVSGGELVWAKGFGYSDVERQLPATPQTVFRLGSVTKLFTATAVLQLRDRGALRLDDPVTEHLGELKYRNRFPEGPAITVRHLLTHTSGLPREADFPYWTDRRFPTPEQMIEALAEQENVYEAGSRYKYSNLGIALLGEVVAAVSEMPYEAYVTRHILGPLGMTSTWARYEDVDAERLATGYLIRRGDGSQPVAPATDANGIGPAADVSSSLEDLARFVSAHLYSGPAAKAPLLAPRTLRDMHRVHWLSRSWRSGRGLGFSVWRQDARTLAGHGGWVAGYRTQVAFDDESGFGVVVLTNSDEGGPGSYLRQAFDFLVPAMEKAAESPAESVEPPPESRYAGAYHNPWGEVTDIAVIDGGLVMYGRSYPPSSDIEGELTELTREDEHVYRHEDNGEPVVFELRPDGRVARVKVGANYLFPADCGRIGEDLRCSWE